MNVGRVMVRTSLCFVLVALVGCSKHTEAEPADVRVLCTEPIGEQTLEQLARTYPAAAGFDVLLERVVSSRWRGWMKGTDKALVNDIPKARRNAEELDLAGKAEGLSSCWAAARIQRYVMQR